VKLVLVKAGNGNPEPKNQYLWIPAGVYPDENRGRNDKIEDHQPGFLKLKNLFEI